MQVGYIKFTKSCCSLSAFMSLTLSAGARLVKLKGQLKKPRMGVMGTLLPEPKFVLLVGDKVRIRR